MSWIPWILLAAAVAMQLVALPALIQRRGEGSAPWQGAVPFMHFFPGCG